MGRDGPHDGTDDLELFIDWLVRVCNKWPLEVVMAAGNFRRSRARVRGGWRWQQDTALRIQPDDLLPSFVEDLVPTDKIGAVTVTATSPLGISVPFRCCDPRTTSKVPNGPVF
jgi:hypothetical protein